jgi:hypothetical protein
MKAFPGSLRLASAAAGLALALGCAKPYFLAPDAPPGDELRTLLVLPVNFERVTPRSWTGGLDSITHQVHAYLLGTGRVVRAAPVRDVIRDWNEATRAVGGLRDARGRVEPARYHYARMELVRRVAARSDADAVVWPTVGGRVAKGSAQEGLAWDGVEREVPVETGGGPPRYDVQGEFQVASLEVAVFGRDGRLLYEHARGLEPLESLLLGPRRFWVQDRREPFEDAALLNDQVRAAFEPFLAPGGASR